MKNKFIVLTSFILSVAFTNSISITGGSTHLNEEYFTGTKGWGVGITYYKYIKEGAYYRYQINYSRINSKRVYYPSIWYEYVNTYKTQVNIPSLNAGVQLHPLETYRISKYVSPYFWFGAGIESKLYSSNYKPPTTVPDGEVTFDSEYSNFPYRDWVIHVFPSYGVGAIIRASMKREVIIEYQMNYPFSIFPELEEFPVLKGLKIGWKTDL